MLGIDISNFRKYLEVGMKQMYFGKCRLRRPIETVKIMLQRNMELTTTYILRSTLKVELLILNGTPTQMTVVALRAS